MKQWVLGLAAALLLAGGVVRPAQAGNLVTSRAGQMGTDFIDWGGLGPAFTVVGSPFAINSNGGVGVIGSQTLNANFERRDQSTGGWVAILPTAIICFGTRATAPP